MAQTESTYPGSIDTGFDVDYQPGDEVPSSIFEKMADAIKEIETELGIDPAGASVDLVTRLSGVTAAEFTQIANIGATAISAAQWAILGGLAATLTAAELNYIDGLTRPPLSGDTTAGRVLRQFIVYISNGTNASTLKCWFTNRWNGDAIGETDNVAKNATTGPFTLSANGGALTIEASGLSGNVVMAFGFHPYNSSGTAIVWQIYAYGNDIRLEITNATTGAALDLTTLVDTGDLQAEVLYITSA